MKEGYNFNGVDNDVCNLQLIYWNWGYSKYSVASFHTIQSVSRSSVNCAKKRLQNEQFGTLVLDCFSSIRTGVCLIYPDILRVDMMIDQ